MNQTSNQIFLAQSLVTSENYFFLDAVFVVKCCLCVYIYKKSVMHTFVVLAL